MHSFGSFIGWNKRHLLAHRATSAPSFCGWVSIFFFNVELRRLKIQRWKSSRTKVCWKIDYELLLRGWSVEAASRIKLVAIHRGQRINAGWPIDLELCPWLDSTSRRYVNSWRVAWTHETPASFWLQYFREPEIRLSTRRYTLPGRRPSTESQTQCDYARWQFTGLIDVKHNNRISNKLNR